MAINREHIEKIFSQKYSLSDYKMLIRYFEGKESNEETKQIVKEQWEKFESEAAAPPNVENIFYKLYYNINSNEDSAPKRAPFFIRISRIAAILIIGILFATSLYFYKKGTINSVSQPVEFISHSGFRNQFKLPDGTIGWLGSDTKIKYYTSKDEHRVVELNGLAYFDVAHLKKHPFIVKTPSQLDIQVLGTKFNVSAYSEDSSCEIVLEQGSIRLGLPTHTSQNMIPGERVIFHSDNYSVEKTKVGNVNDYLAWKDGILFLKDVSLKEACNKLSRFYNVEIDLHTVNKDNQKIRLTLKDEKLEDALKLLTIISPVTWHEEERKALDDKSYSKKKIIIQNK